jgi:hypothetical protein
MLALVETEGLTVEAEAEAVVALIPLATRVLVEMEPMAS